jgi:alkenylglycerophosphocholine/alkenylglycerophosphoethanolamine hydrolase
VVTVALVPFVALALLCLAAADDRLPRVYAVVKPLTTASLFLVLAPHPGSALGIGIAAGLAFATLGDALLVHKRDRRFFVAGMAAFALAHLAYSVALSFSATAGAARGLVIGVAVAGPLTALLESCLLPRVPEKLALAVGIYGAVLTATVIGAAGFSSTNAPLGARSLVLAGALLLYAGDAFYAFNLFVSRLRFGQSAGLVLYFSGQLALMLGVRNA